VHVIEVAQLFFRSMHFAFVAEVYISYSGEILELVHTPFCTSFTWSIGFSFLN